MIGGNIPGETQVLSIALYDQVELLNYDTAHTIALILLVIASLVILAHYLRSLQRLSPYRQLWTTMVADVADITLFTQRVVAWKPRLELPCQQAALTALYRSFGLRQDQRTAHHRRARASPGMKAAR